LIVAGALPAERILGVETGGCPHTAIREVGEALVKWPGLQKNRGGEFACESETPAGTEK
jgi:hypothetical protein